MPYFENYDYNALQEKFVHSRFAEEENFGQAYIEEWLAAARLLEVSFGIGTVDDWLWERLEAAMESLPLHLLMESLVTPTPFSKLREVMEKEGNDKGVRILKFLDRSLQMYAHGDTLLVGSKEDCGYRYLQFVGTDDMYEGLTSSVVLFLIDAEWERHYPHWREARQFVCDLYAADVKKVREEAEKDFAEAIAVSADGTKIVKADAVVVAMPNGDRIKFTGSFLNTFREKKILRSEEMRRFSYHGPHFSRGQVYFLPDGEGSSPTFFTEAHFCPPMP